METSFRLSALVLVTALLTLVLKKHSPELSLTLSLCACALGVGLLASYVEPVLSLAASLAARAELGLLTELSAAVCVDAGQSALAKITELGGGLLCLVVSLPLVQAVLALIEELL